MITQHKWSYIHTVCGIFFLPKLQFTSAELIILEVLWSTSHFMFFVKKKKKKQCILLLELFVVIWKEMLQNILRKKNWIRLLWQVYENHLHRRWWHKFIVRRHRLCILYYLFDLIYVHSSGMTRKVINDLMNLFLKKKKLNHCQVANAEEPLNLITHHRRRRRS